MIRLEHIGKTYRTGGGDVQALQDIDFSVNPGELVAIVGQSGGGKTTLLDILGCLSRPTDGEYWLEGRAVASLSDKELATVRNRKIGFVFQTFHLLPRKTALQNVELPLQYAGIPEPERQLRAMEMLRLVGLQDRMQHHPTQLSGGQQQRVAIARALVNGPAILLADEPTGNLDSRSGLEILQILERFHRAGQTILLVTHERELAERAERVVTLRDGRILSNERVQPEAALAPSLSQTESQLERG
ncbi:MAG: ABC transporter ATP-binding protein [Nitrospiraceae bacterium]